MTISTDRAKHSQTQSVPLGELLTPTAVAQRLGITRAALTDWRYRKRGPRYLKVGKLVRYPAALLDLWLAERVRGAA